MISDLNRYEDLYSKCINNFWHLVGHILEIPKNNSYKCLNIGGHKLFIYKINDSFKAYVNSCPHRGSKLFKDSFGNSPIRCPYHGWTFTLDKTYVPRIDTFSSNLDPQKSRLSEWNLKIVGGFIFISKTPNYSINDQIGDEVINILNQIGQSLDDVRSSDEIDYASSWLISVENALEPYHLSTIHPNSLNELKLQNGENTIWKWASLWNSPSGNKKLLSASKHIKKSLESKIDINGYWSLYLFPFVQISSTEGLSYSVQFFDPGESSLIEKTKVKTTLYSPIIKNKNFKDSLSSFYDSIKDLNYKVFIEDSNICALVPLSSWSPNEMKYFSNLELKVNHFRKCCRRILSICE